MVEDQVTKQKEYIITQIQSPRKKLFLFWYLPMWVLESECYINSSLRANDTCLCSYANKLGSIDIWYHLYSSFPDLSLQEDIGTRCNISQKYGIICFLFFCFALNYWFSSHTAPAMVSLTWSDIWLICISVLSVQMHYVIAILRVTLVPGGGVGFSMTYGVLL